MPLTPGSHPTYAGRHSVAHGESVRRVCQTPRQGSILLSRCSHDCSISTRFVRDLCRNHAVAGDAGVRRLTPVATPPPLHGYSASPSPSTKTPTPAPTTTLCDHLLSRHAPVFLVTPQCDRIMDYKRFSPLCTSCALSTLFLVPNEDLNSTMLPPVAPLSFHFPSMLRWNTLSTVVVCFPFLATELDGQHVNPLSACGRIGLIGCQLVRYFD